jgi:hypothetical protein
MDFSAVGGFQFEMKCWEPRVVRLVEATDFSISARNSAVSSCARERRGTTRRSRNGKSLFMTNGMYQLSKRKSNRLESKSRAKSASLNGSDEFDAGHNRTKTL